MVIVEIIRHLRMRSGYFLRDDLFVARETLVFTLRKTGIASAGLQRLMSRLIFFKRTEESWPSRYVKCFS